MFRVTSVRCPRGCGPLTLDCEVYAAKQCTGYYNMIMSLLVVAWHSYSTCAHFHSATDLRQRVICRKRTALLRVPCCLQVQVLCMWYQECIIIRREY